MRKIIYLFFAFVAIGTAASFISCSSDKKRAGVEFEEVQDQYNHDDTVLLLNTAETYMKVLQSGAIDSAVNMLHIVKNDSIQKISANDQKKIKNQFKAMPVLEYELERMEMKSKLNGIVTYRYKFMENPDPENDPNFPCSTSITLEVTQHQGKVLLGVYNYKYITR